MRINPVNFKAKLKSDLHNHATRGGNRAHFGIKAPLEYFEDLNQMQLYYERYIKNHFQGRAGFISRVRSAFQQAKEDNIDQLCLSFGLGDTQFFEDTEDFIESIRTLHTSMCPKMHFIPEVAFGRWENPEQMLKNLHEVSKFEFFRAIDLVGDELVDPNKFKMLYKKANHLGLIRRAHVGEFSCADNIVKHAKVLELDQIQHGITLSESKEAMAYIKKNKITLNICPTSNILLKRVKSYRDHPIRQLVNNEVNVTINSDDMIIFNQSVSDDYHHLLENQVLTLKELESIRQHGLTLFD